MESDTGVRLSMEERSKGRAEEQAAAEAGISVRAALGSRRHGAVPIASAAARSRRQRSG